MNFVLGSELCLNFALPLPGAKLRRLSFWKADHSPVARNQNFLRSTSSIRTGGVRFAAVHRMPLSKRRSSLLLVLSFGIAVLAYLPPQRRMPLDFHFVLWVSLPLAGLWTVGTATCLCKFGRSTLLMLFGAPLALYWPVWLLFNHIPNCYWQGNCI
jgi:hypothetical protein